MRRRDLVLGLGGLLVATPATGPLGAAGGAGAPGPSPEEVRAELRKMRKDTLDQLYREHPGARQVVRGAAGYAVFSSVSAQVLFVGGAGGRGVVRDNLTGKDTFMKMGSAGIGLGLGARDVRTVLVFRKRATLKEFVERGWQFGGQAVAAAKTGDQGAAAAEVEAPEGIVVYQLTTTGLQAGGSVQGTRYWLDEDLN